MAILGSTEFSFTFDWLFIHVHCYWCLDKDEVDLLRKAKVIDTHLHFDDSNHDDQASDSEEKDDETDGKPCGRPDGKPAGRLGSNPDFRSPYEYQVQEHKRDDHLPQLFGFDMAPCKESLSFEKEVSIQAN